MINPFGIARRINTFNYPAMESFFISFLLFKTYHISAKVEYLLYKLHENPGIPVRRGTMFFVLL